MRAWRVEPAERQHLYGAVGLRLVDLLTGAAPLGRVDPELDVEVAGNWLPAAARILVTSTGIVTAPGLEKHAHPATVPVPRRYRIRLTAQLYRPLYRVTTDGFEFDAFAYDDSSPPPVYQRAATEVVLVPDAAYPFPAHLRVLHGSVADPAGAPVVDAIVTEAANDRAVTDERGVFALPLRTAPLGQPVAITATHVRSARTGSIQVTLPADLARSQTITVS